MAHDFANCYICQVSQPIDQFYKDRTRSNKVSSRCKACDKEREKTRVRVYPARKGKKK